MRGREGEHAHITSALARARQGGQSVIVVVGAGGVGKTRLLRTALADAAREWTFAANVLDGAEIRPELPHPAVPPATPGPTGPGCQDAARLVVVDNAQLVEPARLTSLTNTALADGGCGTVLLVAGRPGRCGVISEWFRGQPSPTTTTIRLGPLPAAAVRDMVADLVGGAPGTALTAFAAQADGNPGLVCELVSGLREEGRLWVRDGLAHLDGTHLPDRAIVHLRRRLDHLSLRCRQLLQVAAMLGRTLHLSLLSEAVREPTAAALPLLEEALSAEILAVHDERLLFQSPLVWRAVHETVPTPIRLALEQEFGALSDGLGPTARAEGRREPQPPAGAVGALLDQLTDKERTIAELVCAGLTNRQIAARVYLSPHTVNYHLRRIFRKLDITSRIELARLARADDG